MSREIPYPSLDTPAILVDLDRLDANLAAMARMTADAGLKLRPNTKVHRSAYVAGLQVEAGAIGVNVSKPAEAVAFADAGIEDIMIAHPFYGEHKFAAVGSLLDRIRISCVVDSVPGAEGLARVGRSAAVDVPVLMKVNTNCNRFGVPPGDPALKLARELDRIKGIKLVGILTHESASGEATPEGVRKLAYETASTMSATAILLREDGIEIKDVVVGATPTARDLCRYAPDFPEITEIHPGAYAFGDRVYMNSFAMTESSCATTVLVTVSSTWGPDRVCVDGGFKTFGADPMLFMADRPGQVGDWSPTYGVVKGRPDLVVGRLTEEIGVLTMTNPENGVEIGDRLEILPNHVSLTVNLHDKMYGVRNGGVETEIPVIARGMDY